MSLPVLSDSRLSTLMFSYWFSLHTRCDQTHNINRDEGSHQMSHVWTSFYLCMFNFGCIRVNMTTWWSWRTVEKFQPWLRMWFTRRLLVWSPSDHHVLASDRRLQWRSTPTAAQVCHKLLTTTAAWLQGLLNS